MSYVMNGRRALGYDIDIDTPLGKQTVSFDLDQVSKDVSDAIIKEAWPKLEVRAAQALPAFMDVAVEEAKPHALKAVLVLSAAITVSVFLGAKLAKGGSSRARVRQPAYG